MKEAIEKAAELVGEDGKGKNGLTGYMMRLAKNHEKTFGALLARIIPLQVDVRHTTPAVFKTVDEIRKALLERGLPVRPLLLEHHTSEDDMLEGEVIPPERAP